ncbi:MAG: UDP-N-acetylmuramoyl-L-alanyl-D-glutamate--2,6-diaminopimelate ligase [Prolixibacteraceae bacterium]|nr:UDP-N-acetylmuramoyl-L-alanyl-D-glutamate--2,6-diaminopimelate ligase [Prolixibacteraceae bacterium]
MRLENVLSGIAGLKIVGDTGVEISGIAFDSRKVISASLFVASSGTHADGHQYIPMAIEKGASAVLCSVLPENQDPSVTWILSDDSLSALGKCAANFYDHPSDKMKVVGVTGTNGKTTTATLLYRLFSALGHTCGLFSTVCNYIGDKKSSATHTTPDAVQIQSVMAEMVAAGCSHCFMEVSSHAIDQQRIAGISFDGAIFSNLTHDHLDYHKTFIEYRNAKKRFFDDLSADAFALTNADDKNGLVMLQNCRAKKYTYSARTMADFKVRVVESHFDGMLLNINGKEFWNHFAGNFNAYNLLAVYASAMLLGSDSEEVLRVMSLLKPVDGRFEIFRSPAGFFAVVDYAHTPDALKNVLSTINEARTGDQLVFCVVGAGGDRDKTKRPEMAAEAAQASDRVILTSDNPRSEEPEQIIADMMAGVPASMRSRVVAITNRKEAIRTACMMAHPGDIILIAGKGHEDYQEIKGVKYHFDDREIVNEIFNTSTLN